jgi:hypothetical protein
MLSDPTPPTLGTPPGALWDSSEADGGHRGTQSVTVSAQDVRVTFTGQLAGHTTVISAVTASSSTFGNTKSLVARKPCV